MSAYLCIMQNCGPNRNMTHQLVLAIIQKMQQLISKKQSDSEFICKLQDMMERYPHILSWSEDGTELAVNDVNAMQQDVLPSYFRHRNFGSFVRQLNMYNFHKVCRQNNTINFKNEVFFRGNEPNFFQIKRKKKAKDEETSMNQFEEEYEPILKSINEDLRLTGSVKSLLRSLIEFKFVAVENQRKIKRYLDSICKQLKDSRSKKVNHIISDLKENSLEQLEENLTISKSIDRYIDDSFMKELRQPRVSSNASIPLLEENKTINEIMVEAKNINFHSLNSLMNLESKKDCIEHPDFQHPEEEDDISFAEGLKEEDKY